METTERTPLLLGGRKGDNEGEPEGGAPGEARRKFPSPLRWTAGTGQSHPMGYSPSLGQAFARGGGPGPGPGPGEGQKRFLAPSPWTGSGQFRGYPQAAAEAVGSGFRGKHAHFSLLIRRHMNEMKAKGDRERGRKKETKRRTRRLPASAVDSQTTTTTTTAGITTCASRSPPPTTSLNDRSDAPSHSTSLARSPSSSSPPTLATDFVYPLIVLCLYFALGLVVFSIFSTEFRGIQTHSFIDAIYWTVVTISTVGYGDISPSSDRMKLFTCFFAFLGIGTVGLMLSSGVAFFLQKHEDSVLRAVERSVNKALSAVRGDEDFSSSSNGGSGDDDDDDDDDEWLADLDPTGWNSRAIWRVCLALFIMLIVLGAGVAVLMFVEGMLFIDALYTACISVSTIGYGDYSFQTLWGRVFAMIWLLAGSVVIGWCFVELANAKMDTQKQILHKKLLTRNLQKEDFAIADLDGNNRLEVDEFIIFKLKEMARVTDEELQALRDRFNTMDVHNKGYLTVAMCDSPRMEVNAAKGGG